MLTTIIMLAVILWWAIDRVKPVWANLPVHGFITTMVAMAAGIALALTNKLDLLFALDVTDSVTFGGQLFAGIALMAGSSGVNELIRALGRGDEKTDSG